MQVTIDGISYYIADEDIGDIKLLLVYAEYLERLNDGSVRERLYNFFIGTPKDANLSSIQDLVRPDIFLKTPIENEMQRIFALLVKYKNDYKMRSGFASLFEQRLYDSRMTLKLVLKAIFVKLDSVLLDTVMTVEVSKERAEAFRKKLLAFEGNVNNTKEVHPKEQIEMDYVEIDVLQTPKENIEYNKQISLLVQELNEVLKLLEDNTDPKEVRTLKTDISIISLKNSTEKTAISISHEESLAKFLAENAVKLINANKKYNITTALSEKYGHKGTLMLAAAAVYKLVQDLSESQPMQRLQMLQCALGVFENLGKCIKNMIQNFQLPEVMGPKDFEDFYKLVRFYKNLRNFNRETTKLYKEAKVAEDYASVQKKSYGGLLLQFAASVTAAATAAGTTAAQKFTQYTAKH